jgi:hypothetical protein
MITQWRLLGAFPSSGESGTPAVITVLAALALGVIVVLVASYVLYRRDKRSR